MIKLSDEAVEAAGKAVQRVMGGSIDLNGGPAYEQFGRAALLAALPHLTDDGAAAPRTDDAAIAAESATTTAAPSSPLRALAEWLVRLDDPGSEERRTVTLTKIINNAAAAITAAEEGATPAIDREALIESVSPVIGLLVRATHPVSPAQRDRITRLNAEKAADAVLALLRGAAQ